MRSYDKSGINHQILVDMCLDEYTVGAAPRTNDKAKLHHPFVLNGGAWNSLPNGLPYLLLNTGNPDFVECPGADSADVNFTNEDFTLFACVNGDSPAVRMILNQGVVDVDGWEWFIFWNNISLRLNQAGGHTDISAVDAFTQSVPQIVAVTRHGAAGQFYVNGLPVVTTLGAGLTDAVSCAGGNKLLVGVQDNETTFGWNGRIYGGECAPKLWNRALTAVEIKELSDSIRHWLGV